MPGWRRVAGDPALLGAIVVLWALLALFVIYPLAELLAPGLRRRGPVDAGAAPRGAGGRKPSRGVLQQPVARRRPWACLGTALGFLFAFTRRARRAGAALAHRAGCRRASAAGLTALHHVDLHHLLVRAEGLHQPRPARPRQRLALRLLEHGPRRDADLFPHRLSHAAADPGGDRSQPRGDGVQPGRLALADLPHRHPAAGRAGLRQRLPAAVRRVARRFRHAPDPCRQFLSGAADPGLPADHRHVRLQGRRDAVAGPAGAGGGGVPAAALLGRTAGLRYGHRQGRPALAHPCAGAMGRRAAGDGLLPGGGDHRLFLRPAALRLAGRGLRRQQQFHLAVTTR